MSEIKDELLLYPRGKNDDLLDGLYYANKKVYTPTHKSDKSDKPKVRRLSLREESWLVA